MVDHTSLSYDNNLLWSMAEMKWRRDQVENQQLNDGNKEIINGSIIRMIDQMVFLPSSYSYPSSST